MWLSLDPCLSLSLPAAEVFSPPSPVVSLVSQNYTHELVTGRLPPGTRLSERETKDPFGNFHNRRCAPKGPPPLTVPSRPD